MDCVNNGNVFEEEAEGDTDLKLANNDHNICLKSIETKAFHDGFDESNEKSLQKAFDTGYELIYKYFETISRLEGIYDVLNHSLARDKQERQFEDLKPEFSSIYSKLFSDVDNRIESELSSLDKPYMKADYNSDHIKPCRDVIESFNCVKTKVMTLCSLLNVDQLYKDVNMLNIVD